MSVDIGAVQPDPALPPADRSRRRGVIGPVHIQPVTYGVGDHIFCVVFERNQDIREHAVYPAALWIAALMPRDEYLFRLPAFVPDNPAAVISEEEDPFLAHGTKVFSAVR